MESEQEPSATAVHTMPEPVLFAKEEELNESSGFPYHRATDFFQSSFPRIFTDGQALHVTFAIVNAKPSEMIRIPIDGYGKSGKTGRIERPTFESHLAGPWYIHVPGGRFDEQDYEYPTIEGRVFLCESIQRPRQIHPGGAIIAPDCSTPVTVFIEV